MLFVRSVCGKCDDALDTPSHVDLLPRLNGRFAPPNWKRLRRVEGAARDYTYSTLRTASYSDMEHMHDMVM